MRNYSISCAFSIGKTNLNLVLFGRISPNIKGFTHPYYSEINVVGFCTLLNTFVFQFFLENIIKEITLTGEAH